MTLAFARRKLSVDGTRRLVSGRRTYSAGHVVLDTWWGAIGMRRLALDGRRVGVVRVGVVRVGVVRVGWRTNGDEGSEDERRE